MTSAIELVVVMRAKKTPNKKMLLAFATLQVIFPCRVFVDRFGQEKNDANTLAWGKKCSFGLAHRECRKISGRGISSGLCIVLSNKASAI